MPIVLAAGNSLRMGGYPKALLPLGKDCFLTRILHTLQSCEFATVCVVLGARAQDIRPFIQMPNSRIVINPHPERGQLSSLQLALETLDGSFDGCLVWPVDQPVISAELVKNLRLRFEHEDVELALPSQKDCAGSRRAGHPAILGRALISALRKLPPDANPKEVIRSFEPNAAWLDCAEPGAFQDVDTPEDYFRVTGELLRLPDPWDTK
jgi:CTP:molybdopterin cytidylyltransferase MocA